IELLVVIIIIAILAAIAIPTFLGQRQKAQDAAAKSLVRNAMTAVESQFVDSQTYNTAAAAVAAKAIEPSINFDQGSAASTAANAGSLASTTSLTSTHNVEYWGTTAGTTNQYTLDTQSASGNFFGVFVDKAVGTTYVKKIGGSSGTVSSGW
ncbi:MAG: hypothetical protein M0Z94_10425, partial [Dehalococcoidales bacterium]|nr:hypothetical protein [Dehalococcoidales bacterium]